ncbi:hypothetical protein Tco_0024863 [Tanacetum coccineum]
MGVLIVSRRTFQRSDYRSVCGPDESDPLNGIRVFEYQGCPVRDADYVVGCSVSKSELPGHSYVVDSTVSSIETNVELVSNIVTNSSLGDRILNVGMTDDPFSGSTTTHSDDLSPSSSPVKTSDNFEKFADELAPLDSLPPGNDDSTLKKDLHEENFQIYSNPLFEFDDHFKSSTINPLFDKMEEDVEIKNSNVSDEPVLLNTPLSDKVECFAPEDDIDEIDAFLAMEVSSNFEEGTDISNITRKPSKTDKHGHEERKSTREAKDSKPKPEKIKPQSKKVKP